jgi:hypothetical protein
MDRLGHAVDQTDDKLGQEIVERRLASPNRMRGGSCMPAGFTRFADAS